MSNQKLADAAQAAMTNPSIERQKGYCSRFVRQVVASVYGNQYAGLFGASAIDTGNNFKHAGFSVPVTRPDDLQIGDILFKMTGSGGFGHVGIYVGAKGVAENSSTSLGRISGAKGYRTLEQWGKWQVVGRIPGDGTPADDTPDTGPAAYQLIINGVKITDMPIQNGHALCPVRAWATALGFQLDWDDETRRVLLDGHVIDAEPVIIDNYAHLPIRTLAASAGLAILNVDTENHTVTVGRPAG